MALKNPNLVVRWMAWTALHQAGQEAESELADLFYDSADPRLQARALWLLGKIERREAHYVQVATESDNPNLRIVGIRLARQLKMDLLPIVRRLVRDSSAAVRRELAIALRHIESDSQAQLWSQLAIQHDGRDRWYLEALGIGADLNWDACLAAWLEEAGDGWNTPAGRDIVWRSRAKLTPSYLAQIVKHDETPPDTLPRYLRAFDFFTGPEKDKALESILDL